MKFAHIIEFLKKVLIQYDIWRVAQLLINLCMLILNSSTSIKIPLCK